MALNFLGTANALRDRLGLTETYYENALGTTSEVQLNKRFDVLTQIKRNGTTLTEGTDWSFVPPNTVKWVAGKEPSTGDHHEITGSRGPTTAALEGFLKRAYIDVKSALKRCGNPTLTAAQEEELAEIAIDLSAAIFKEDYLEKASNSTLRGTADTERHKIKWRERALAGLEAWLKAEFPEAYKSPDLTKQAGQVWVRPLDAHRNTASGKRLP